MFQPQRHCHPHRHHDYNGQPHPLPQLRHGKVTVERVEVKNLAVAREMVKSMAIEAQVSSRNKNIKISLKLICFNRSSGFRSRLPAFRLILHKPGRSLAQINDHYLS